MPEKFLNNAKKIIAKTVFPLSLILLSSVEGGDMLTKKKQKQILNKNQGMLHAELRFDGLPYGDDEGEITKEPNLDISKPIKTSPTKSKLIINQSIAFIAGPKEGYNFVHEINLADSYLKLAKELGLARIAVELPNKLNEKEGQDYLQALAGLSQKHNIQSVLWISNSLPGAQLPLFEVNKAMIAKHPEWFLHNSKGQVIVDPSEFKSRAYQNPFSQGLKVEQTRLIKTSVRSLNADSILFDDLAIPIQNSAFKSAVEFKNQIGGNGEGSRQSYYYNKMKNLQDLCRQLNKKMILSTQLSNHSSELKTMFNSPKFAAQYAQEAMPQIYTRVYYSSQGKEVFNSQLARNVIQFNKNKNLNPSLKITPLVFSGYPEQPNSTGDILAMSRIAKAKLNAKDIGVFPLKTIFNMSQNDHKSKENIQKAFGSKN